MYFAYAFEVFPGQDFPRPSIVLSDRAQVFLTAALQIWNNESMCQFLNRAYRIVTNETSELDLKLTNIHACLSHVLLVSFFSSCFQSIVFVSIGH